MNIIFFDLETTGTDIAKDRIVQIAAWKLDHEFAEVEPIKTMLLNPGIPISKEATAVHGITDDMVKDSPSFAQIAKALFEFCQGCAFGGFNILNFDVPILSEEFLRCKMDWPAPGTLFVDAYKIFAEKERRDLAGAARFYLDMAHDTAHDAAGDVQMTVKVLAAQMVKYPELQQGTLADLHTFCIGPNSIDLAGKLERNDSGDIVYAFGKDKGKVVKANPGYAHWMLKPEQSFPAETKRILREILYSKQFQ